MTSRSAVSVFALLLALSSLGAQDTGNRAELLREQAAILRKAERLRDLMQRLLARYEREGRTEQVKLLQSGLEHLTAAGLLEGVADIRTDLQNNALTEAVRKQTEVLDELERLLNILMDRRSIENLDREIERSAEMARDAAELARRQEELQQRTREATSGQASPTERELANRLSELAQRQAAESQRNAREAGLRMPFLENALQRIQELLRRQQRLDETLARELNARPDQPDPAQQQAFRIGELLERQRELLAAQTRERDLQLTDQAARELGDSLERDDEALRQALSKLASRMESSVRRGADSPENDLARLQEAIAKASPEGDRAELRSLADRVREVARQRAEALAQESAARSNALRDELRQAAREFGAKEGEESKPDSVAAALQRAAEAVQKANELAAAGKPRESLDAQSEAGKQIGAAHQRQRNANPDAERLADEMASESAQVAQTLRRTPNADPDPQGAEQRAAGAMDEAERAQRQAAEQRRDAGEPPDSREAEAVRRSAEQSRAALERAQSAVREAIEGEMAQDAGSLRQSLQQAGERQDELRQQTEQLARDMQQAQSDGNLTEKQARAAEQGMQRAQQAMQKAKEALGREQQSTAAGHQQQAADALEQTREALESNRPLSTEQRKRLEELAQEQKQLEEDIIRLAKLAEERKNRRAQEALQQAAQSAQRASRAMQDGEQDEADQQQQETREQLEQAQEALQEERDRYMDLRQEELLFRIRDELTQFLEKQRTITAATQEAAQALDGGRQLTRPMRRKLNTLGEQERELESEAAYLRTSLEQEGTLVFTHALKSNEEDLADIAQRLGNRTPDPGEFTVLLQQSVEERTLQLLEALKREQQRRQQEGGSGSQQGQNRDNPNARPRLVPVIAELKMLRQMEQDMLDRTRRIEQLLAAAGADGITATETALIERLGHRHTQITQIFLQIKTMIEQALQEPGAEDEESPQTPDRERRGRDR
jgi:hypothetical protein